MSQRASDLEFLFHPRSIAVVGAASDPSQLGARLFVPLVDAGFQGKLYPVHPKGGELLGYPIYPSLKAIPGEVDYVIVGIPAALTPSLIEECAQKGVRAVTFFTAGFSETGEEGKRIETEMLRYARSGGVRLLGPNCMGLYCPKSRLSFVPGSPKEPGPVGVISQSGGNSIYFIRAASARGLRFSKVISYGNACDLNESDFLHYLAHDPDTKVIAAYIEGIKDGERFQETLTKAAAEKPVIVLKGGCSFSGYRTSASHTGSLMGVDKVWYALLRQCGAIQVESLEELIDLTIAFLCLAPPKGKRAGVVGWGGGASVQAADDCEREGLIIPPFPPELEEELKRYTGPGSILKNPVDSVSWIDREEDFKRILGSVANWEGVDFLLCHLAVTQAFYSASNVLKLLSPAVDVFRSFYPTTPKPMVLALHSGAFPEMVEAYFREEQRCFSAGLAVFPSVRRAARAISKMVDFSSSRSGN